MYLTRSTLFLFLFLFCLPVLAELTEKQAETRVRTMECKDGESIEDALEHKIKRHSQRDLGWRVFSEAEGRFDVERAILINKGMQIHYRWRVDAEYNVKPLSKRAEKLCLPD